ncbi:hypothetical protein NDU88_004101, partial [Pleurodeles waltl]
MSQEAIYIANIVKELDLFMKEMQQLKARRVEGINVVNKKESHAKVDEKGKHNVEGKEWLEKDKFNSGNKTRFKGCYRCGSMGQTARYKGCFAHEKEYRKKKSNEHVLVVQNGEELESIMEKFSHVFENKIGMLK